MTVGAMDTEVVRWIPIGFVLLAAVGLVVVSMSGVGA